MWLFEIRKSLLILGNWLLETAVYFKYKSVCNPSDLLFSTLKKQILFNYTEVLVFL